MEAVGVGISHRGNHRTNNEDSLYIDDELGLYIVCDGTGGRAAGEVASRMTVDALSRRVTGERSLIERVAGGLEPPATLAGLLARVLCDTCADIHEAAGSNPDYAGMVTTATLLVLAGQYGVMAHVGDSRLYLCRDDSLSQLSTDHTLVAEMLRYGLVTREQARRGPYAHVITRSIGLHASVLVDTLIVDILPDDVFLLCTDGLTDELENQEIERILSTNHLEYIPDLLVERALDCPGRDNITVVCIQLEVDAPWASGSSGRPWAQTTRILEALESSSMFVGLSLAQLQRVANLCELMHYRRGERVFQEGQPGHFLAVLVDGRLSVTTCGHTLGYLFEPGDTVGMNFLVGPCPAGADIEAERTTRILHLDGIRFQQLCQQHPCLGVQLLTRLGRSRALALLHTRTEPPGLTAAEWL